ncbi:MAG: acyl carrier protein [Bacilli bacterium]|nr:acyl carrier protein [Bacilli bacterium]
MNPIEVVKDILKDKVDVSSLKEDDPLSTLGLDSLDLVEVMLAIEDRLNVEFTSTEISSLATLKDVISLINQKLAK